MRGFILIVLDILNTRVARNVLDALELLGMKVLLEAGDKLRRPRGGLGGIRSGWYGAIGIRLDEIWHRL